jgi:hypothetical protein
MSEPRLPDLGPSFERHPRRLRPRSDDRRRVDLRRGALTKLGGGRGRGRSMLGQHRTREPGMPRGLRLRPGSGPKLLGAAAGAVLVVALVVSGSPAHIPTRSLPPPTVAATRPSRPAGEGRNRGRLRRHDRGGHRGRLPRGAPAGWGAGAGRGVPAPAGAGHHRGLSVTGHLAAHRRLVLALARRSGVRAAQVAGERHRASPVLSNQEDLELLAE